MPSTVLLITPPFTQLNTPYPATVYLKGFLNTRNIACFQADLGIEVIIEIFSKKGLIAMFAELQNPSNIDQSDNAKRIIALQQHYIDTIEPVIEFLQGKDIAMEHLIAGRNYLPESGRFDQLADLDWAFGSMGMYDKAKFLATMYLEDLSDLIKECIDEHFGFTRYAEHLGRSANSFDELNDVLHQQFTFIDRILLEILEKRIEEIQPEIVGISVPFPGNLYAGFRCAQWIKNNYPEIKIVLGGGFPNTELRSISDTRVFNYFDFITLDDGEAPLENLIKYIQGSVSIDMLKRTFLLHEDKVVFKNNPIVKDYKQGEVGTPDYSDLLLDKYISAIEIINPMHSLWSNGRWNKLTMAHGCYWGKCTFCDISLDYIKNYEPVTASLLCDRMEELIKQTGFNGFHFVDEAAPPALMRALAIEIIKRKLIVSWWTNIRFEKSFTRDLCLLLKASGCIGISGGLEVASDRLLELIQKGITVAQVARVNKNFTDAGIMVHAYLMYGFPTQTTQETINSMEMVRQLFEAGILQSAFWHLFAMTAHSPVGLFPEKFNVKKVNELVGTFANNDIEHIDPTGANHEQFSFGLKKSLLNYMQGIGFEKPLNFWFEFKIPQTTVPSQYIKNVLMNEDYQPTNLQTKILWLGQTPIVEEFIKTKKGNQYEMCSLKFYSLTDTVIINLKKEQGLWLNNLLKELSVNNILTLLEIKENYKQAGLEDFELFWENKPINTLYRVGLLKVS